MSAGARPPPPCVDHRWQERFQDKVTTAEEAIRLIPPGRRILIGSGAAEPVTLVEAMVHQGTHLADNEVVHLLTLGPAPYVEPGFQHRFRHTAFFIGSNVRKAVQEGRADFMPVFLSEIPELICSKRIRIDVALVQISPPDAHGYASLGVSVDIVRSAVETADLVLAEVNPNMPRTHGASFVHVGRIHKLVPVNTPLLPHVHEPPDDISREIGRLVAQLVPDGATLQTGIGKIPDALLSELGGRKDLGIHTEMLSDGIMALAEAGVITGRRKTLLPGKIVTSFVMGSQQLYEWVDDHAAIEMRPSDFTNDPMVIARNDQMIAINGALAVDLTGQVAADSLSDGFFSGIGGQVDFIRGAARSRGGKAIIALPSCVRVKGQLRSRIQPCLDAGMGVVTSRGDVHYVVTEYGSADLWGKNVRERALALISIAHPDFRGELLAAAKGRKYVLPDQVVPRATYPWTQERIDRTPGGQEILIRPARLTDERPLQELFYRLSDESIFRRFFAYKRSHPHEEVQELVDLDYEQNMALVVCPAGTDEIIAVARYDVDPATRLADLGIVVRDDWQGRGVGTALMRRMAEIAEARGLAGFQMDVLPSNKPMLAIARATGRKVRSEYLGTTYRIEARFRDAGAADRKPTW